jgi:hypothetical protein
MRCSLKRSEKGLSMFNTPNPRSSVLAVLILGARARAVQHSLRRRSSRPHSDGAEAAHAEYEKRTGQPDAAWADWYAAYMVAEQAGKRLPRTARVSDVQTDG